MSGGSFDYLFAKDAPLRGDVERMADTLDAYAAEGIEHAARAAEVTRAFVPPEYEQPIRDVWRAVEWRESNDYGRDQVEAALSGWDKAEPEERWPKLHTEPVKDDDVVQVLMTENMARRFEQRCLGKGNTVGHTYLSPALKFSEDDLPTYLVSVDMPPEPSA